MYIYIYIYIYIYLVRFTKIYHFTIYMYIYIVPHQFSTKLIALVWYSVVATHSKWVEVCLTECPILLTSYQIKLSLTNSLPHADISNSNSCQGEEIVLFQDLFQDKNLWIEHLFYYCTTLSGLLSWSSNKF